ncbi:MAG: class I SAM-dependent methyltransferase [Candidatus Uhrbacteria bacterium]|nr:class I SAM-dependent methyltransferase [Candidatus Uhrbacteria bacterium]
MIPAEQLNAFVRKYAASFRDVGTVFLSHVDSVLTPEAVLVDVGCGRTSYGEAVYRKAAKRIGLDVDPYAKENELMDEVVIMKDEYFPLPDACADVVAAQWVVEHVVAPDIFLSEIYRVLKPGGAFVFMTTNIRSPIMWPSSFLSTRVKSLFRSRMLGYAADETFPTVYAMNTPRKLQALAEKHGFTISHLDRIESFGYFRFSRVLLWTYIQWTKLLHLVTRNREMHLVGVFVKEQEPQLRQPASIKKTQ